MVGRNFTNQGGVILILILHAVEAIRKFNLKNLNSLKGI